MGARIPPSNRPRRGGINCEFCGRAVPSAAALRSHQTALHSQALKEKAKQKTTPAKPSKVQKPEPTKEVVKKVKPKPAATDKKEAVKKVTPDRNTSQTAANKPKVETPKPKPAPAKPKADNKKGKVEKPTLKMESEQPLKVEARRKSTRPTPAKERKMDYQCPKCEKLFPVLFIAQKHIQKHHSNEDGGPKNSPVYRPILLELCMYCNEKFSTPHECPNRPDPSLLSYNCTGCLQQFKSNKLFDMHVADVHGDQTESMFFLTDEEFTAWKNQMESQTECKYTLMGKYNKKEIYRCSEYADNTTDDAMVLCPSSIIVSKCAKGSQVHFHPHHYKHDYKKYELNDLYKTFTITDLIEQAGNGHSSDDTDLYLQFKTLMESIVFDAAKINIDMLKRLYAKANDMMSLLQEYDEDQEVESISNRSTLSLNTSNQDGEVSTVVMQTRTRKRTIEDTSTIKSETAEKKMKTDTKTTRSSVKKSNTFSLADDKDSEKILQELDSENILAKKEKMQSPTTFNDTFTDFIKNNVVNVAKNAKPTTPANKKRNVVKTKMGQFKPSLSPKKDVKHISAGKTKDFEYEVREQENDCNILVLKL